MKTNQLISMDEVKRNYRFVCIYIGNFRSGGFMFDGAQWPLSVKGGKPEEGTIRLVVSNLEEEVEDSMVVSAESQEHILDEHLKDAGLIQYAIRATLTESGKSETEYLSPKSKEDALLEAFDKLANIVNLTVKFDYRDK